jgi:hypothetical protein
MTFVIRNFVLLHVAALAVLLAWVHGGTRVDHLQAVPWLAFLILNALVLMPAMRRDETSLVESRRRVMSALIRDPLLYASLLLNLFLFIQWANGGNGVAFNTKAGVLVPQPPPIPWLPSCVDRAEAGQLLFWFPPACVAVLAVRHGIKRRGQRLLLNLLVWNGALLALFGIVQNLTGTTALFWITPLPQYFFASFGYPNHAGAYFGLLFALSAGLWCRAAMEMDEAELFDRRRLALMLLPVLLCLAGVWWSHSRAAIILASLLLIGAAVYLLIIFWKKLRWTTRIQAIGLGVILLTLGVVFYRWVYPDNPVRQKMALIDSSSLTTVADYIAERWMLVTPAMNMFHDHPAFGVGGWGFRQHVLSYMSPAERDSLFVGAANVHNDLVQFIVEQGLVGFGLMAITVILVVMPLSRALQRIGPSTEPGDKPAGFFQFPPVAIITAGLIATCLHCLVDLPFRCPAILITWLLILACLPAFVPQETSVS